MSNNGDYINYLNARHAIVMIGGKCVILNETFDPVFNRQDLTFSTVADFKHRYSNRKVKQGKKRISIARAWLESRERREYEGIIFSPAGGVDRYYNLYRGFACEPCRGDWSLMQAHILEVICNNNQDHYSWLFDWMSYIVQNPGGERPGIAIVLRGKRGTGKGVFVNTFGKIFGVHFLHLYNSNQLVRRFNQQLKDCILCFADEAFFAGDKK